MYRPIVSAEEIEQAIRKLPPEEAKELLNRVQDLLSPPKRTPRPLTDEVIEKWKVRSDPFAGMTTDQYLRLIRDGDSG
jgi:hypothetical protein